MAVVAYTSNTKNKDKFGEWSGRLQVIREYEATVDLFTKVDAELRIELKDGRSGKIIISNYTEIGNHKRWIGQDTK